MTHPDVRPDVVALAVSLQVPLNFLMGQEAVQLGVKGEIREHHHLLRQVGPVRTRSGNQNHSHGGILSICDLSDRSGPL